MTQTPVAAGNPYNITLHTVLSATGSEFHLRTREEAVKYEEIRDRYQNDNGKK